MSSLIDMTISTNYVPGWRTWEGIRELVQNAFDREREDSPGVDLASRVWSRYPSTIEYNKDEETLVISSPDTKLERRTLILGEGTKAEGGTTIGQHGEGYKLAIIALLRSGHTVEIANGNERWVPSFIDSKKLHAEVLRIEFQKGTTGECALTFRIGNVMTDQWETVKRNVRRLHEGGEEFRGDGGWVLTDDSERGRLYVGGIYVTNLDSAFMYGYDFDPDKLHLDRDRSTVDSFNLQWECGNIHATTGQKGLDVLVSAVLEDSPDVRRIPSVAVEALDKISDTVYTSFREKHGDRAFPVSYQWEVSEMVARYRNVRPVIVGDTMRQTIVRAQGFRDWITGQEEKEIETPESILRAFLERYREYFPQTLADKFDAEIIERSEKEGWSL